MRIGTGENFLSSRKFNVWVASTNSTNVISFIKNANAGDRSWFITSNSGGQIIAVATYINFKRHDENSRPYNEIGWFDDSQY